MNEGFLVDQAGLASSQCDILIWTPLDYSPLYVDGDFVILPVDSVQAVIEVKTTLNKATLESAFEQLRPIHEMNGDIYTAIFAFESIELPKCLRNIVFDLELDVISAVDSICGMNGWVLQRLEVEDTDEPGIGVIGLPKGVRREQGDHPLPFHPILDPRFDEGYDLAAFLGFLFFALDISHNPSSELLTNSPIMFNTLTYPGIGRAGSSLEENELFRRGYESFLGEVERMQRELNPPC